jgi:predicted NBD/HSP70 family sugar kinase
VTSHPSPTRPDAIRRHNLAVMLWHLHRDGALTRAQLTQRLGVSRSTIGSLVADLIQLGLVEEAVPSGGAGVGRPSHVVTPRDDGPFVVAVDVDVTDVTIAAVGVGGSVRYREVMPNRVPAMAPEVIAQLIADAIERMRLEGQPGSTLVGVGVSVPGTVDRHSGRVGVAPNLGWRDAALGSMLLDLLQPGVSVTVGNDADVAVLAEYRRGSARECEDVVFLMGRIGVGAGIIVGGQQLQGRDGHAGEIGHNVVDVSGPPCHCGKRGCTETYIGDIALLTQAGRDSSQTPPASAIDDLFADARRGDRAALGAIRAVADPLGRAIASLVNTLNPERVILGGSLSQLLDLARPDIEASLEHYALEAQSRTMQLAQPGLGADSALLGAAEMAFADLLADPLAAVALPA